MAGSMGVGAFGPRPLASAGSDGHAAARTIIVLPHVLCHPAHCAACVARKSGRMCSAARKQ